MTSAKQWKKNVVKGLRALELPSGNTAKVKAPGMQAFLAQGFIPNSLMSMVIASLDQNSGKTPKKTPAQLAKERDVEAEKFMKEVAADPTKIAELMTAMDKVWLECVVEPETLPATDEVRDDEHLYVDEVDFDDKMFVFQFAVGGTRDIEQFRKGVTKRVGAVQNKPRATRPTKRTTGRTAKSR